MTATTFKRGAARQKPVTPKRKPAPRKPVRLPVAATLLYRRVFGGFALLSLTVAGLALWLLGIPQGWWFEAAQAAGRAGYEVRHVEVNGVHHGSKLPVYAAALDGPTNSMLIVDLEAARQRLRALPWVADASVARRLPDTLLISITERTPVALWQYQQRVAVIDRTGAPLTRDNLERFAKLPLVVGEGANTRIHDFLILMADHGELAKKVDAAIYVGNRRWDLRFKSGETLALPEGDRAARAALISFESMDRGEGLLAKGFARFDMRLPGKMTVRVGRDPGSSAAALKEIKI